MTLKFAHIFSFSFFGLVVPDIDALAVRSQHDVAQVNLPTILETVLLGC